MRLTAASSGYSDRSSVERLARVAFGVVDIAYTVPHRLLGIRTVRARARDAAGHGFRADDRLRGHIVLHPVDEGRDPVHVRVADAAAAVAHAGDHVEAQELVGLLFPFPRLAFHALAALRGTVRAFQELHDRLAIADAAYRVRAGIAPAVVHDDFFAAFLHVPHVRISGL